MARRHASLLRALTLFILFSVASTTFALTRGEKDALRAFKNHVPALGDAVQPHWDYNFDNACAVPFYGLTCSPEPDPHVLKMYETTRKNQKTFRIAPLLISPPLSALQSAPNDSFN